MTALDVAKYFLAKTDEEVGATVSNLKLQKLIYYAQGYNLAVTGKPLFKDKIKAWQHGPVIPALYHKYKKYGSDPIPKPDGLDLKKYTPKQVELLDEVYEVCGQFSAWKLRNMTHEEPPWKDVAPFNGTITHKSMKKYFKTLLN